MTLDVRWGDIEDKEGLLMPVKERYPEYTGDDKDTRMVPSVKLETLCMLMLPAGFNKITHQNVGEVWARIDLMQRIQGSFMLGVRHDEEKNQMVRDDVYFTKEDIIQCISLASNASIMTRAQFVKLQVKQHMDEQSRAAHSQAGQALAESLGLEWEG